MTTETLDRGELALLQERLRRARARVESSSPGGPEFDAAMAALEELEARLESIARSGEHGVFGRGASRPTLAAS